jgi:hypothetical protein
MPGPVELLNATPGLSDWTVSTRQGVRDELYFGPARDATPRGRPRRRSPSTRTAATSAGARSSG